MAHQILSSVVDGLGVQHVLINYNEMQMRDAVDGTRSTTGRIATAFLKVWPRPQSR